jgi:hypothetical protein
LFESRPLKRATWSWKKFTWSNIKLELTGVISNWSYLEQMELAASLLYKAFWLNVLLISSNKTVKKPKSDNSDHLPVNSTTPHFKGIRAKAI